VRVAPTPPRARWEGAARRQPHAHSPVLMLKGWGRGAPGVRVGLWTTPPLSHTTPCTPSGAGAGGAVPGGRAADGRHPVQGLPGGLHAGGPRGQAQGVRRHHGLLQPAGALLPALLVHCLVVRSCGLVPQRGNRLQRRGLLQPAGGACAPQPALSLSVANEWGAPPPHRGPHRVCSPHCRGPRHMSTELTLALLPLLDLAHVLPAKHPHTMGNVDLAHVLPAKHPHTMGTGAEHIGGKGYGCVWQRRQRPSAQLLALGTPPALHSHHKPRQPTTVVPLCGLRAANCII